MHASRSSPHINKEQETRLGNMRLVSDAFVFVRRETPYPPQQKRQQP